ncbi:cyclic nucleotide-binding domain-containing protein [Bradyrhizobium pachyrhizi]|uniref:Thioredoxin reductase n=1 Tax=Bradyrhizobium pachyrhizi TaxID=280333 RepID=A0A844SPE3_9BRAD|nr:cyclic nucleotide-binding domain-containing thioredoxin-disulfide reductase [Bradyrhizobium pachyrhizi]MVT64861.1 cyclic nucleotide-binding domain-containing protein [Bradyrhizobium pachyrhizi]
MSTIDERREQLSPKLTSEDVNRLCRFGQLRAYAAGDALFVTGDAAPGMYVLINGRVRIVRHDPFGQNAPIMEQGPGEFVAGIGQLSGQPALVDVQAMEPVEALLISPENMRAVLIDEPDLGERIMNALILRRVVLVETGAGGPVLIGSQTNPDVIRLQGFLARNAYPCQLLDPANDLNAARLVEHYGRSDLPLVVCPNGSVLKNPDEALLARDIGMVPIAEHDRIYDVAIVGAGPAGLSTAVYAASGGLSAVVLDAQAFGGQAGASALIENYLGFPAGVSGQVLADRAYIQAEKFGARMIIPSQAKQLDAAEAPMVLDLDDGTRMKAWTTVIATGACYRRLDIPLLQDFEGRGVWYWASPIEARLCRNEEIVVVGGGNSAGQAAVFLSDFAAKVWMLVRGAGLAVNMSEYLIDRIHGIGNIEVLLHTEIVAVHGTQEKQLAGVRWRNGISGQKTEKPIHNIFLFIGADAATGWLKGSGVALDSKNFILTGSDVPAGAGQSNNEADRAHKLETSVRGVFACGDVRSGSTKRVGAAIGEGAVTAAELFKAVEDRRPVSTSRHS